MECNSPVNFCKNSKQTHFPPFSSLRGVPTIYRGNDVAISAYHFRKTFKILQKFKTNPFHCLIQTYTNYKKYIKKAANKKKMLKYAIQTQFIGLITVTTIYTNFRRSRKKEGPYYMRNKPIFAGARGHTPAPEYNERRARQMWTYAAHIYIFLYCRKKSENRKQSHFDCT